MSASPFRPDASALSLCLAEAAEIGLLKMEMLRSLSEELKAGSLTAGQKIAAAALLGQQQALREQEAHRLIKDSQRQQYLDIQEQKRADAKERGDNLAEHRRKRHYIAVKRLRLGHSKFRHSKKQAEKREEERALKAAAAQEKAQALQQQKEEQQAPRTLPKLILTPVAPGPEIEAMRIAAGIPKGGVPTTGAAAWYYDDKPELKAERETEAAEMAEIRIESDAMYEAKQKGDGPALTAAQARHALLVEKATQRQERLRAKKLKEYLRILDEKRKAYDRDHPREMRPVLDEQAYNQKVYQEQRGYEEIDEDSIQGPPLNTAWMQDENWQPPQPDTAAQTESPPPPPPQPPCALSQPTALGAVGPTDDDTIPQPHPTANDTVPHPPHPDTPDSDPPDPHDPPTRLELYQQEQRERKEARNKLLTELGRKAAYELRQQNKWW